MRLQILAMEPFVSLNKIYVLVVAKEKQLSLTQDEDLEEDMAMVV